MTEKNIVTIGGGTGTPIVNEALLLAGAEYIQSVVTVMDSGGVTGRMRTDSRGEEIAYSDALRTLISLIPTELGNDQRVIALNNLLRKRNGRGQDLGYTIFSHYFHQENGFLEIKELLENLTGIKLRGEVIPVTLQSTNLVFTTNSGQKLVGEHELDAHRLSQDMVQKLALSPSVEASKAAVRAISFADVIIYCCGSFYGSIIVNLLPAGIKTALHKTRAKKVLLTNLASTRNETHEFLPEDFVSVFKNYTGQANPLDMLIVPDLTRLQFEKKYPLITKKYSLEYSHFLGWSDVELQRVKAAKIDVLKHAAFSIDPLRERLRHNPQKLKKILAGLI